MPCLSGFELYSRWVPLPFEDIESYLLGWRRLSSYHFFFKSLNKRCILKQSGSIRIAYYKPGTKDCTNQWGARTVPKWKMSSLFGWYTDNSPPPYLTINSRLSVHTIFRQLTSISLRSRRRVFFLQAARGERAWPASISPNIYIWPLQAWNYSYFVMLNQVFQSKLSISILHRSLKDWPEKVFLREKELHKHHSPFAQRVVSAKQEISVNFNSILQSCLIEFLLICSWFF